MLPRWRLLVLITISTAPIDSQVANRGEIRYPLAADHTVVAADLPGYGDSRASPREMRHESLSKREIACTLVDAISAPGSSRFAVVGHDRGARVAYSLALDHHDRVLGLGVLDVIPTLDVPRYLLPRMEASSPAAALPPAVAVGDPEG